MGNVLPSDLRLHRKFDLKGSTYGRTVGRRQQAAAAAGCAPGVVVLQTCHGRVGRERNGWVPEREPGMLSSSLSSWPCC